jgi:beta-xylosidase
MLSPFRAARQWRSFSHHIATATVVIASLCSCGIDRSNDRVDDDTASDNSVTSTSPNQTTTGQSSATAEPSRPASQTGTSATSSNPSGTNSTSNHPTATEDSTTAGNSGPTVAPIGTQTSNTSEVDTGQTNGAVTGASSDEGASTEPPPVECPATYSNPLIWEDLPDLEVIRVDDTYYYTASSFHHSPGAPLLRSYDLVHWEYLSHSVPRLDFDAKYDQADGNAYVNGIWASTLQYRPSNKTFYWMGCMHNVGGGWVFTSTSPEGPWEKHKGGCYYDMGLLIDDDDKMYVASGNNTISVAELSDDGLSQVKSQTVFQTPDDLSGPLEGSRFYKIDGNYYILVTQYANGEYVLRSTSGPFGPYELKPFAVRLPYAGVGAGGSPHQGGIIETQNGEWYYMGFNDSYPAGRIPVMAPVTWNDGWPSVTLVDGKWGASYPFPNLPCASNRVSPPPVRDTFAQPVLRPEWQWNHNPDDTKWAAGDGLVLQTATVTDDLYDARNTLTRRIEGPVSIATIELDFSAMQDGDVAGLAALRDRSATIAVKNLNGSTRVVMTNGIDMNTSWTTTSTGTEVDDAEVTGSKVWLRAEANVRTDNGGGQARFFYSTDGTTFTPLGNTLNMNKSWEYFLGYRFGLFNYATKALGGSIEIAAFSVTKQ